jgi:LacI family transcriptional regulator
MSMRVDGLLISVTEETKDIAIFNTVAERNLPLVFFDRVIEGLGFDCVTSDDFESSRHTIERMINGGYTKIAHLAGYRNTYIGLKRMAGFKKAFEEKNMEVPPEWIIEGGFSEQDGYHGFNKLVKTGDLPEVIFTVTYPVALGVLIAAEQLGVNIPGEVELLTFGGSDYNRFMKPSLTYIDQPAEDIGRVATELLLQKIRFPDNEIGKFIEIPTELVFCETCKKF